MNFMEMENNIHIAWDAVLAAAGVCAVGFAVWYIFFRRRRLTLEEILAKIFGKPLYAISFSQRRKKLDKCPQR